MQSIQDILLLQKRELEQRLSSRYVVRDVPTPSLKDSLIKVIIGPRRAGKSSYAIHTFGSQNQVAYVNFDDEVLVKISNYDDILNALPMVYPQADVVLFDEIQNLSNWELFVNRLQRQNVKLIITGSNSNLLSTELTTHLTGRFLATYIFPFSFKEFLQTTNATLTESEVRAKFDTYLLMGGFPEPLIQQLNYKDYLTTLFNAILFKDIVKRFNIRYVTLLDEIATYLLANVANEFSATKLSKVFKCSANTLLKYLGYLEEAFLFFKVNRFSYKAKEQIAFPKKIYCIDNGYVTARSVKFSPDLGRLSENLVAVELKKREIKGEIQLFYWRDPAHGEVDFVVKLGTLVHQLIQVCYNWEGGPSRENELRSLLKASDQLNCDNLLLLSREYEAEEEHSWYGITRKVVFLPLWKWLHQGLS